MIVRSEGATIDIPSIRRVGLSIVIIDQRVVPLKLDLVTVCDLPDMIDCIKTLRVRGAPAIGSFAAFSLSICIARGIDPAFAYEQLALSRPTAVDLRNCLDRVMEAFGLGGTEAALAESDRICSSIVGSCREIGKVGAALFKKDERIMTHCNAGALATIDWGTALAPIRVLSRSGMRPFVYVSETRPLLQGSRLTAWELSMEGIDHKVLADSACAPLMRGGLVDSIIVGADRVCRNGDIANKIGTLDKAILAQRYGIPFYVAFPWSTIDPACACGEDVPIEFRGCEDLEQYLRAGATNPSDCWNPAFDWTPSDLISAFITEKGIIRPSRLSDALSGPS
jgi:S-methyl-5-thioribose-1-phosphate isomerase